MDLREIIELLGFKYHPSYAKRISELYTDYDTIYDDYGVTVFENAVSGGIKIEATYLKPVSADSLVDIGFEILSRTHARDNNVVSLHYTTPDTLFLEIHTLRDVNY